MTLSLRFSSGTERNEATTVMTHLERLVRSKQDVSNLHEYKRSVAKNH